MHAPIDQTHPPHIADGFPGQRMLRVPQPVIRRALVDPATRDLIPTDIGYFPDAAWHDVDRPKGTSQLICIYCVRGTGWARCEGSQLTIGPGDVLLLPPDRPHAYGSGGIDPWTIYWAHLAGQKVPALWRLAALEALQPIFHPGEDAEVLSLFEEAYELLARGYGPENLLLASLCVGRLMGRLLALRSDQNEDDSLRNRIQRTADFMLRRRNRRVTVPELARQARLSGSHYSAVFKQQMGFPPLDYFLRLKMRRACELLDTTRLPIKQIADQLGFTDPLYFSRQFRKIHEISPVQYRLLKKG